MPRIIPIVEGDGDVNAMPLLIRKILRDREYWNWEVGSPKKAKSLDTLRKRLDSFLGYALKESDCGGILIVLDLDDGCPVEIAQQLAHQTRQFAPPKPVTIVLAHREYESWFLASATTFAGHYNLPTTLTIPEDVEQIRGAKEWLNNQLPAGIIYKETSDQAKWTNRIDLTLAHQHSRSFRRLVHAIEQLVTAADQALPGYVTPEVLGGQEEQ